MLTQYLEKTNLTLGIIRDCTVCLMEMLFLKGTFLESLPFSCGILDCTSFRTKMKNL